MTSRIFVFQKELPVIDFKTFEKVSGQISCKL